MRAWCAPSSIVQTRPIVVMALLLCMLLTCAAWPHASTPIYDDDHHHRVGRCDCERTKSVPPQTLWPSCERWRLLCGRLRRDASTTSMAPVCLRSCERVHTWQRCEFAAAFSLVRCANCERGRHRWNWLLCFVLLYKYRLDLYIGDFYNLDVTKFDKISTNVACGCGYNFAL